jgi:hypothetical protein
LLQWKQFHGVRSLCAFGSDIAGYRHIAAPRGFHVGYAWSCALNWPSHLLIQIT